MNSGVEILYDGNDDPPKITVSASNNIYTGHTSVYTSHASLKQLHDDLASFPNNSTDISYGTTDDERDYISFRFIIQDRLGHGLVIVSLANGFYTRHRSEAHIPIDFDLASLDRFVDGLNTAIESGRGLIYLEGRDEKQ